MLLQLCFEFGMKANVVVREEGVEVGLLYGDRLLDALPEAGVSVLRADVVQGAHGRVHHGGWK